MKRALVMIIASLLLVGALAGCSAGERDEGKPVVDTIYIGHHYVPEVDPTWRNETTGEPGMSEARLKASMAALATVKEELGVDIKWKQWQVNAGTDCLRSILAGDPYSHFAILSNGGQATAMSQNILQPLDKYLDIFDDPDAKWILPGKTFGNYYLLNRDFIYITDWPICYNVSMVEAVPELKDENGNTLFPYDLYKQGKWTWSVFEDYLRKIQNYYSGRKSERGNPIYAFDTNYNYIVQLAFHSNGASIYDGNSMGFDSPEAVEAAEYLEHLMESGLIRCSSAKVGVTNNAGWMNSGDKFNAGETVFSNIARWRMGTASHSLAERGESMGIMFFPRPDDIPYTGDYVPGASQYEISKAACDSFGLLRGFSEEESRLALKALLLFHNEMYKNMGKVDTMVEYAVEIAPKEALSFGIDIFHPTAGAGNLEVFKLLGSIPENEYSEIMGIMGTVATGIFGESVYSVNGTASGYGTAVKAKKQNIYDSMNKIADALKTSEAKDVIAPSVGPIDSKTALVFKKGTNPKEIDWSKLFVVTDNVDGTYEMKVENGHVYLKPNPNTSSDDDEKENDEDKNKFVEGLIKINVDAIDFNTAGAYENGIVIELEDTNGNKGGRSFTAYVYDEDNTTPPTLVLKPEYGSIALEADTSALDWAALFVDTATDVNGTDLRAFVTADVRELDVTTKGTYNLTVYVVDFSGNRAEETIQVKVE